MNKHQKVVVNAFNAFVAHNLASCPADVMQALSIIDGAVQNASSGDWLREFIDTISVSISHPGCKPRVVEVFACLGVEP